MPEKEAHLSKAVAGVDFRTLELEIDREIDSLFVPTVQKAEGEGKEAETSDVSEYDLDRVEGKRSGKPAVSFDIDAIQVEIDKEIDGLFVPAARSVGSKRPVQAEEPKQPMTFGPATSNASNDEAPPDDTFDSQQYHSGELSGLIEIFNAAYLSLDWEFSRENIRKFIDALSQLEPFASRSHDSKCLLRILDAILKRLLDRPHAINSSLVQLIRDSQGLLAHMLLLEGETGSHEKRRLKDLIERFQELRQRALAVKAGTNRSGTGELSPEDKPSTPPEKTDLPGGDAPARALSPTPGPEPVEEKDKAREKSDPGRPPRIPVQPPWSENLCLMVSGGKCFALPASCVVRAVRSPARKCLRILKRGYATLADYTPAFRRVRSRVFGEWTKLPSKELKSYRFEPFGLYSKKQCSADGAMAVLASDGKNHAIVFCDIINFIAGAEISTRPPSAGAFGPHESQSYVLAPIFDPLDMLSMQDRPPGEAEDGGDPLFR